MTFGQNLKYLREIHHVKQDDLAAYLKVTRSAIAGYETRGKQPDYEKLIQIAKYFNVSVDYLLTGKQTDASAPSQDHLPHTRIQDHELLATYQALSPLSKRRLWDYMQVLKLAERSESDQ